MERGSENISFLSLKQASSTVLAPNISIILPTFNEAAHIIETIKQVSDILLNTNKTFEVLVIDDGSTDNTFKIVQALTILDHRIHVLHNEINTGKGFSIKKATEHIKGDYVIILDADMEIKPKQISTYIDNLMEYDMCIGSKRHPESNYQAPLTRKFLSISFNAIVRLLTGIKSDDTQSGLKAFKVNSFRKIMDTILVKRYAFDVEIMVVAQIMGLKIKELPINIEQEGKFNINAILYMLVDILGIAYRLRIIKWYQRRLKLNTLSYNPIIPL